MHVVSRYSKYAIGQDCHYSSTKQKKEKQENYVLNKATRKTNGFQRYPSLSQH